MFQQFKDIIFAALFMLWGEMKESLWHHLYLIGLIIFEVALRYGCNLSVLRNPDLDLLGLSGLYMMTTLVFLSVKRCSLNTLLTFLASNFLLLAGIIVGFADAFTLSGVLPSGKCDPDDLLYDFGTCLYFSVITWTTVGYGDFVPSAAARTHVAIEALMGYCFMGFTLSATFYLISLAVKQRAFDVITIPRQTFFRYLAALRSHRGVGRS